MNETAIAIINSVNHYAPALTFIATMLGVVAASLAAWRAKQLLEAGREADRNQNRAYLTVSKCEIAYLRRSEERLSDGSNDAYGFRVWVKNTGATPAAWFMLESSAALRRPESNGPPADQHRVNNCTKKWTGMAAGEEINFVIDGIEVFELISTASKITAEPAHVTLDCVLRYKTLLDEVPQNWKVNFSAAAYRIARYRLEKTVERTGHNEWDSPTEPLKMQFAPIEQAD